MLKFLRSCAKIGQVACFIKGLKGVPELQFKVQGFTESCTHQSQAPRGRAVIQMISRHFDLDRVRGSLITFQSVFLVELNGYSVADLQEFSSRCLESFSSTSFGPCVA
jgi:hypothetical protein